METIPEDQDESLRNQQQTVLKELYRSEKVEQSQRKIPQSTLANTDLRTMNPDELGPAETKSTSYLYTYEASRSGPSAVAVNGEMSPVEAASTSFVSRVAAEDGVIEVERHQLQSQKVTKVTKVTTTRTIEQIPQSGIPYSADFEQSGNYVNIDPRLRQQQQQPLSASAEPSACSPVLGSEGYYVTEYSDDQEFVSPYAVPSAPGVPQVVHFEQSMVTLVWLFPDSEGDAGPVIGFLVEYRNPSDCNWYSAHEGLIREPQFTVSGLQPDAEYEFRVLASNAAGLGEPSTPSAVIHLTPQFGELSRRYADVQNVSYPPGRPQVVEMDGTSIVLAWEPPIETGSGGPVAGYVIEYRPPNMDWMLANDYPVQENRMAVRGLRPNGEYEFRVKARNADGYSEPSQSTGFVRVKPIAPPRSPFAQEGLSGRSSAFAPNPPSQPQAAEVDSARVTLLWAPPLPNVAECSLPIGYHLECREIGDPSWFAATERLIEDTQFTATSLRPNSTYEFRVYAKNADGWSEPSEVSEIIQLRPKSHSTGGPARAVPVQPSPPEIMELVDDTITICWAPAYSALPIQGYQVDLRDLNADQQWLTINPILTTDCKLSVSNLILNHQYEFRVLAKNAIGYSEPSLPSQAVTVGPVSNGVAVMIPNNKGCDTSPLPDEIRVAKESPPLTDTEDSPPPLRRQPPFFSGGDGVQWRDPTLQEVIDFLAHPNNVIKLNAAGYLQHLTYHDDANKQKAREFGAIPKIVELLRSDVPEIQRNAAGCLRNISYGRQHDENKRAIRDAGGIATLANLLRTNPELQVKEEITGAFWNLSSCDELKRHLLEQATEPLVEAVVIPSCGLSSNLPDQSGAQNNTVFRNTTGVLRNVSSVGEDARKKLREQRGLVDSLVHFLRTALDRQTVDNKSVENAACILRNLSYRCQEVVDPEYDKHPPPGPSSAAVHERSKSAPSGSPKGKSKKESSKLLGGKKKKDKSDRSRGEDGRGVGGAFGNMELLWQPEVVKLYLRLLQDSSNPETLEASAGAVQNLAACYWTPSVDIRATVRKEKGLPIFVELLRMEVDRVVCSVAGALRNLAMDQRNKELIGKYAMKDLIAKLPSENQPRDAHTSDETISAVLGVLYQTIVGSSEFARNLLDGGGVDRLLFVARSRPNTYSSRVVKYASQVLLTMWQHKELHEHYRKQGLKESDFVNKSTMAARSPANTLARPVSTQGGGNTHARTRLSPDAYDASNASISQPVHYRSSKQFVNDEYSSIDANAVQLRNVNINGNRVLPINGAEAFPSPAYHDNNLYAQVQKSRHSDASPTPPPPYSRYSNSSQSAKNAGDSWV